MSNLRLSISILSCWFATLLPLLAQGDSRVPLAGYSYAKMEAPTGNEWQSPELLSLNKEQPHAWFFDFKTVEEARAVLPYQSTYWQSLDGVWKFHWAPDPDHRPLEFYRADFDASAWDDLAVPSCWNVQGIQKDGSLKYGVPIYCNQPVIFQHTVAVDDWRGGVMREPKQEWTTYKYRNEVGSYRRTFTVPAGWKGKEIYLDFEGVNSFFYLWVNGRYVGFSKNSRTTASFDISEYLVAGENVLAVEVYRNSDGSFLEAQDMWRLPGIYRSVSLRAKNKVQVEDVVIRTTELGNDSSAAQLKAEFWLRNCSAQKAEGLTIKYNIYRCKLWEDENSPVAGLQNVKVAVGSVEAQDGRNYVSTNIAIPQAQQWSSEAPNRYLLVGQLVDRRGKTMETFSTYFGVRKVEIRETSADEDEFGMAGRYYYINNKTVKLKGVNRQEICLEGGNTITREQIIDEIMLMRRGNINHVRTSHYANQPYWFYACDKYGIYLEDEANIESHEYYYGKASLSHVPEFRDAHVARVMESVHSHVNSPCVVIWSLGNEAGPGENFVKAYEAVHQFDPSRPVQYERNNEIVDMGSNQYPSVDWVRALAEGWMDEKYPFHISEYAHSMGNAGGDLKQYWEAIESSNYICGGAIWDWVDQALWNYTPDGQRYMAYGGDFGDKPNDETFCMNGILFPDHSPKPEFDEVKKVYQYVGVKMLDVLQGRIEVMNKNYFTTMEGMEMRWSLWADGKCLDEPRSEWTFVAEDGSTMTGKLADIAPRQRRVIAIPYDFDKLTSNKEYYLRVQFVLTKDTPWASSGYVQAEEEFAFPCRPKQYMFRAGDIGDVVVEQQGAVTSDNGSECFLMEYGERTAVRGKDFEVVFDNLTGTIHSLTSRGQQLIAPGQGPRLDAYRAPVDNDNWATRTWKNCGLDSLQQRASRPNIEQCIDGTTWIGYTITAQAPGHDFCLYAEQLWTIYVDGTITLQSQLSSNQPEVNLPRIGYLCQLDSRYQNFRYYGRGPRNNYNDRCSGSMTAIYQSTVTEQFVPFPRPQDMANREEVRWCELTDSDGSGLRIEAMSGGDVLPARMSVSALGYSDQQLAKARHPHELPKSDAVYLHLDAKVTGLGGNSCGQGGPLDEDCTRATNRSFGLIIKPITNKGQSK